MAESGGMGVQGTYGKYGKYGTPDETGPLRKIPWICSYEKGVTTQAAAGLPSVQPGFAVILTMWWIIYNYTQLSRHLAFIYPGM